jgi:hypothetical protein
MKGRPSGVASEIRAGDSKWLQVKWMSVFERDNSLNQQQCLL